MPAHKRPFPLKIPKQKLGSDKTFRRNWKIVQRRRRFRDNYLATGNALQSAIKAGYSETTARMMSPEMAARVEETMRDCCEAQGVTKSMLIETLKNHLVALEPKWNAKAERWDFFQNISAQQGAYDRLVHILEKEPPKVIDINMRFGVALDSKDTKEAWLERNKEKLIVESGSLRQAVEAASGPTNGGLPKP